MHPMCIDRESISFKRIVARQFSPWKIQFQLLVIFRNSNQINIHQHASNNQFY